MGLVFLDMRFLELDSWRDKQPDRHQLGGFVVQIPDLQFPIEEKHTIDRDFKR